MSLHETKCCPRCSKKFECKPGNITQCQCYSVQLSPEEHEFIKEMYDDCLCHECLLELKGRLKCFKNNVRLKFIIKNIGEINGFRN
jgi:hypothetical protein